LGRDPAALAAGRRRDREATRLPRRARIDASEAAADIGLVGEVVADDAFDDRIDELSRELAAKPAFAMRAAKEALNAARDGTQAGGLAWSAGRGPDCSAPTTSARGWRRSWRSGSPTSSNGVAPRVACSRTPRPVRSGFTGPDNRHALLIRPSTGDMDQLRQSLLDAPIIEKGEYQYFVHPISDGVPMLKPELLREIVIRIIRKAELENVDKIVTPPRWGSTSPPRSR